MADSVSNVVSSVLGRERPDLRAQANQSLPPKLDFRYFIPIIGRALVEKARAERQQQREAEYLRLLQADPVYQARQKEAQSNVGVLDALSAVVNRPVLDPFTLPPAAPVQPGQMKEGAEFLPDVPLPPNLLVTDPGPEDILGRREQAFGDYANLGTVSPAFLAATQAVQQRKEFEAELPIRKDQAAAARSHARAQQLQAQIAREQLADVPAKREHEYMLRLMEATRQDYATQEAQLQLQIKQQEMTTGAATAQQQKELAEIRRRRALVENQTADLRRKSAEADAMAAAERAKKATEETLTQKQRTMQARFEADAARIKVPVAELNLQTMKERLKGQLAENSHDEKMAIIENKRAENLLAIDRVRERTAETKDKQEQTKLRQIETNLKIVDKNYEKVLVEMERDAKTFEQNLALSALKLTSAREKAEHEKLGRAHDLKKMSQELLIYGKRGDLLDKRLDLVKTQGQITNERLQVEAGITDVEADIARLQRDMQQDKLTAQGQELLGNLKILKRRLDIADTTLRQREVELDQSIIEKEQSFLDGELRQRLMSSQVELADIRRITEEAKADQLEQKGKQAIEAHARRLEVIGAQLEEANKKVDIAKIDKLRAEAIRMTEQLKKERLTEQRTFVKELYDRLIDTSGRMGGDTEVTANITSSGVSLNFSPKSNTKLQAEADTSFMERTVDRELTVNDIYDAANTVMQDTGRIVSKDVVEERIKQEVRATIEQFQDTYDAPVTQANLSDVIDGVARAMQATPRTVIQYFGKGYTTDDYIRSKLEEQEGLIGSFDSSGDAVTPATILRSMRSFGYAPSKAVEDSFIAKHYAMKMTELQQTPVDANPEEYDGWQLQNHFAAMVYAGGIPESAKVPELIRDQAARQASKRLIDIEANKYELYKPGEMVNILDKYGRGIPVTTTPAMLQELGAVRLSERQGRQLSGGKAAIRTVWQLQQLYQSIFEDDEAVKLRDEVLAGNEEMTDAGFIVALLQRAKRAGGTLTQRISQANEKMHSYINIREGLRTEFAKLLGNEPGNTNIAEQEAVLQLIPDLTDRVAVSLTMFDRVIFNVYNRLYTLHEEIGLVADEDTIMPTHTLTGEKIKLISPAEFREESSSTLPFTPHFGETGETLGSQETPAERSRRLREEAEQGLGE